MSVILASQSPRRKELLGLFHIPFEIRVADIDETMDPRKKPYDEVARVSRLKALAVEREKEDTVIAADTIVVCEGRVLGKPRSEAEAFSMLRLLSGREAEAMEPMLKKGVAAALYAPGTGTVNPWQLGIAAFENALQNGAEAKLNAEVLAIRKTGTGFEVETDSDTYPCKMVFNCAGLFADKVHHINRYDNGDSKLDELGCEIEVSFNISAVNNV
mgnify:CR=1 FL=1